MLNKSGKFFFRSEFDSSHNGLFCQLLSRNFIYFYIINHSYIFLKKEEISIFSYSQLYALWHLLNRFQQILTFCSCMFANSNDNCILHLFKKSIILIQNKLFELLKKFKSLFFSSCWCVKINQSLNFDQKQSSFLTIWFLYTGMTKERGFYLWIAI